MDRKACWKMLFSFVCWPVWLLPGGNWQRLQRKRIRLREFRPAMNKRRGTKNLDVILLNNQGYKKKRKGPVEFTHKKHAYEYRFLCWDCHHDYKDGQNIWVPWGETKRCSQCHDPRKKEPNKIMLQKAFHYQCKGCHKELEKIGRKAGAYKKCGGCHQEERKKVSSLG